MLEGDFVARVEVGVEPREEDEFEKMALGKVGHSPERGRLGKNGEVEEREVLNQKDGGEAESGTEEVSINCRVGRGGGNRRKRDGWRRRKDLWRGWRG